MKTRLFSEAARDEMMQQQKHASQNQDKWPILCNTDLKSCVPSNF